MSIEDCLEISKLDEDERKRLLWQAKMMAKSGRPEDIARSAITLANNIIREEAREIKRIERVMAKEGVPPQEIKKPAEPAKQMSPFEQQQAYRKYVRDEGAELVPVDQVVPMEKQLKSGKLLRGKKHMADTRTGRMERRKPLTGIRRRDGKVALVDGNTTFHLLKKKGAPLVPVEIKKTPKQPPEVANDLDAVYDHAKAVEQDFKRIVGEAAKLVGGKAMLRPGLKGRERALQKVEEDYAGDARALTDILAGTIVVEGTPEKYSRLAKKLDESLPILDVRDKYANPQDDGYRDINMKIVLPNGHVAELQINSQAMIDAKEGLGHKIYEARRTAKDEDLRSKLTEISRRFYEGIVSGDQSPASSRAFSREIEVAFNRVLSDSLTGTSVPSDLSKNALAKKTESPSSRYTALSPSTKNSDISSTSDQNIRLIHTDVNKKVPGNQVQEIHVKHGTPNEVKGGKFSLDYVGTGEGHAAFGVGAAYTSTSDRVVNQYARMRDRHTIVYKGKAIKADDFPDQVADEYGAAYIKPAADIEWAMRGGRQTLPDAIKVAQDISPDLDPKIIEEFGSKIEFLPEQRDTWWIRPAKGSHVVADMSGEETLAYYDMVGSASFIPKDADPIKYLRDQYNQWIEAQSKNLEKYPTDQFAKETIAKAEAGLRVLDKYGIKADWLEANRRIYDLTVNKGVPEKDVTWLDWYKPVSKSLQEKIVEAIRRELPEDMATEFEWDYLFHVESRLKSANRKHPTGEMIYDSLTVTFTERRMNMPATYREDMDLVDQANASALLLQAGISGNRYPVGTLSGTPSKDQMNYVVFDPDAITIDKVTVFEHNKLYKPVASKNPPKQLGLFNFKPARPTTKAGNPLPMWMTVQPRIRLMTTGKIPVGSLLVRNDEAAASLLAPMRKEAQETAVFLMLDKTGYVLEALRVSRGSIGRTHIDPMAAVGRIFNTPGVDTVYFAHNHPGGTAVPSSVSLTEANEGFTADVQLSRVFRHYLALKGIKMKSIIIGGTKYARYDIEPHEPKINLPIKRSLRRIELPIKTRSVRGPVGPRLTNDKEGRDLLKKYGLEKKDGFFLQDSDMHVVGYMEFVPGKHTVAGLTAELVAAMEKTNARLAVGFFNESLKTPKRKPLRTSLIAVADTIKRMGYTLNQQVFLSGGSTFNMPDLPIKSIEGQVNLLKNQAGSNTVLYSGLAAIPMKVMGGAATGAMQGFSWAGPPGAAVGAAVGAGLEFVGGPLWDNWLSTRIPDTLEKVPALGLGVKFARRALDTTYRGDLENKDDYLRDRKITALKIQKAADYGIALGNKLMAMSEDAQLRMGQMIRGETVTGRMSREERNLAKEARDAMLYLGKQYADLGFISEKTFFLHAGKYMPRLYTSKEYKSLLTKYDTTRPPRFDLSRSKHRKDIPKKIREEMGEILTPGYPIAKGIVQLSNDIELAQMFNRIAQNPQWAFQPKPPQDVVDQVRSMVDDIRRQHPNADIGDIADYLDAQDPDLHIYTRLTKDGRRRLVVEMEGQAPDNFKQLPKNKKLGRLSEAFVHPEIYQDMMAAIKTRAEWDRIWTKWLSAWKIGKVIWSPKTHLRNLGTNFLLMHMGGLPLYEQPPYLVAAARSLRDNDIFFKEASDWGLTSSTFTQAELRDLYDQVDTQLSGVKAGSWEDALGAAGKVVTGLRAANRKLTRVYELEEQWGKMAMFIYARKKLGMDPEEAAALAEKWLFNYNDLTHFQRAYRKNPLGSPFATFTFKAIPRVLEASIKTPHRMFLPVAIMMGIGYAARKFFGDTEEQERAKKKLRPEWQQGHYLGIDNFTRVPVSDDAGREYWWNTTYDTPWGDLGESGGLLGIPGGLMPFSQPFVKEFLEQATNYDWFWKGPVVKDTDRLNKDGTHNIVGEVKARMKHFIATMAPTPVIDADKIYAAYHKGYPDYRGRYRPKGVVLADVIFGVKMYPVDYSEEFQRRLYKLSPRYGEMAKDLRRDLRKLYTQKAAMEKRGKDTGSIDKQISEDLDKFSGLSVEVGKIATVWSRAMGNGLTSPKKTGPRRKSNWQQRLRERTQ